MSSNMKKAKRIMALLVFSLMVFAIGVPMQFVNAQSVTPADIEGHWANEQISTWIEKGLVKGYPDGTFKPNNGITRAEFSVLVNKSFKFEEEAFIDFTDVRKNDWFYGEIAKAKEAGYLGGYTDGTVKPNASISRQEVATIVSKLRDLEANTSAANKFTDAAVIPVWSKGFVGAVVEAKYMSGYPDGTFQPTKGITRAEAVVALNNVVSKMEVSKEDKVTIKEIDKKRVKVGSKTKVAIKVDPKDAKLSIENSDKKIVKATLKGNDIELKGLKEGKAKITVTAKKDGLKEDEMTFAVEVYRSSGGGGGSSHHDNKPTEKDLINEKDSIIKYVDMFNQTRVLVKVNTKVDTVTVNGSNAKYNTEDAVWQIDLPEKVDTANIIAKIGKTEIDHETIGEADLIDEQKSIMKYVDQFKQTRVLVKTVDGIGELTVNKKPAAYNTDDAVWQVDLDGNVSSVEVKATKGTEKDTEILK